MKINWEMVPLVVVGMYEAHCVGKLTEAFGSYAVGMIAWLLFLAIFIYDFCQDWEHHKRILGRPLWCYHYDIPLWVTGSSLVILLCAFFSCRNGVTAVQGCAIAFIVGAILTFVINVVKAVKIRRLYQKD